MTVKITKPALNLREELNKLDKPSGITGESLLRADTAADAKKTLGIDNFEQVSVSTDGVISADGLNLGDSDKIQLGDSNDLQIYHDGSNSIITDNGTGDLSLRGNGLKLQNPSGETYINCVSSGAVGIRYDDATKLATTSTGVNVTGTVTADGLDVNSGASNNVASFISTDYQAHISFSDSSTTTAPRIGAQGDDLIAIRSGTEYLYRSYSNGNFSLFENTGTTPKFHWDASAESLILGGTSPVNLGDTTGNGVEVSETGINIKRTCTASTQGLLHLNNIGTTGNVVEFYIDGTQTGALGVASGAALTFNSGAGSSERMRIDSSGKVGIGTDSPSYLLSLEQASPTLQLKTTNTSGTNTILFSDSTSNFVGNIKYNHSNNSLSFATTNSSSERMRIDSDGNVGIGTTSPSKNLDITSATGNVAVRLNRMASSTATTSIELANGGTGNPTTIIESGGTASSSNGIVFKRGNSGSETERMRIDSSGNVLVGKTNATTARTTTVGHLFIPDGRYYATASGSVSGIFSRTTSDGDIVSFYKDGSTVGSIGVASGQLGIDSQGTRLNLQLSGTTKAYVRSGSLNPSGDNTFDLGESSERFKDLYLSGDINLSNGSLLKFKDSGGTNRSILTFDSNNDVVYAPAGAGVNNHIWKRNGSEKMRLNVDGNLLVGTTDSNVSDNTTGGGININGDGEIKAAKNGTVLNLNRLTTDGEILRFKRGGTTTVGSIGTASSGNLYLEGSGNHSGFEFGTNVIAPLKQGAATDGVCDIGSSSNRFKDLYISGDANIGDLKGTADSDTRVRFLGSDRLAFNTGGSEAARFDASQNFIVGATVTGTSSDGARLMSDGHARFTTDGGTALYLNRRTSGGPIVEFRKDNTGVGSVSVSNTATTYNTSSDQRLKDNIVDAPSASDDIDAIQVRSFDWKADGSHQKYGMVAQELNTVAPEAVTEGETEDDMMSVDYSKLVPMLVKEIQSLRARVAQLEGAN